MSCRVLITGHWIRVNVNVPSRGVTRCHVLVTRHAALTPPQVSTAAADESETSPLCAGRGWLYHSSLGTNIAQHGHRSLPAPGSWLLATSAFCCHRNYGAAAASSQDLGHGAGRSWGGFQKQFTRAGHLTRAANDPLVFTFTEKAPPRIGLSPG